MGEVMKSNYKHILVCPQKPKHTLSFLRYYLTKVKCSSWLQNM